MTSFTGQKLTQIEKNLIRGIYLTKIKDFEEDYLEDYKNSSLFMKLKR